MPKCDRWLPSTAPPVPPPNGLRELFQRKMKALGISSAELGKRLHVSAEAVRCRISRGNWNYRDMQEWAVELEVTADELGAAILYGTRK